MPPDRVWVPFTNASPLQGKGERDVCYEPMKQALLAHFAHVPEEERYGERCSQVFAAAAYECTCPRVKLRVLVPGAGLCRLAWDVANMGLCLADIRPHCALTR